ncbi:hypothetical protein AB0E63_23375 [Kribbella sp. NPDC026596]|uniref:hypothetical protein n=1 Tax=Kribbella sp. NPDC026596 TaxID=3155122 RepID=UPI0033C77748
MTDTLTNRPATTNQPQPARDSQPVRDPQPGRRGGGWLWRLGRAIAYDALLVPVGVLTMADAVLDEKEAAVRRWRRQARLLHPEQPTARAGAEAGVAARAGDAEFGRVRVGPARVGVGWVFGVGLVSSVVGLVSWFLGLLVVMAVVRGPFYGFVEDGPFGPGTWGGPTKAGAWAVHAAVAVPAIVVFLLALRGIAGLQARLVRGLDGTAVARWVLPATIAVATGGLMFFWSWLQQL